jgi:NADH dehydrogenase FAD-containing subunit
MKTVIIVGSGFYGVQTANKLAKTTNHKVVLISPSDYTYFVVSSVRAVVYNDPEGTVFPLKDVVDKRVEIIKGIADFFDERVVQVNGTMLNFDALIIATGSRWFDPISSTYSFGNDYQRYFKEQHDKIESASHIVLVGGGFNNTELAGELLDRYAGAKKITLIHSLSKILPDSGFYSEKLRDRLTKFFEDSEIELILSTKATVSTENPQLITLSSGETIEADLVITSTGVRASVPEHGIDDLCDSNGFIKVDEAFQCSAVSTGNIFAIGDVNDFRQKGLVPLQGWIKCLTNNINVSLDGTGSLTTVQRQTSHIPTIVTLGRHNGIGQLPTPFGTFLIPRWICVWKKSQHLFIPMAQDLFGSL